MAECRERTGDERRLHMAAIGKIVGRWQSGEIITAEKAELIARENLFYHGRPVTGATGRSITTATAGHGRVASKPGQDRDYFWTRESA